ncbi:MAG TPA: hypothetical protein VMT22_03420 [Terriglobales bacterium]|jgi:hypothetical protein|nr:hypothetical protein [Terriglobales bacterium]
MIRPEFRKILLDQRGAAVILWSCFFISVPIYIVIARNLLGHLNIASNPNIAEPARVICWLLTVVDLGYYFYWKKRRFAVEAILQAGKSTKLFRALEEFQGPQEERAAFAVSTYVTRKVVVFAIIEAIAVYGFVAAFLGRFSADQYALSALSLGLLTVEFPSEKSLAVILQAAERETPKSA